MRSLEEVEIVRRMNAQQRLDTEIAGRFRLADSGENGIDPAAVLCRRMHRAVEELARRIVAALPVIPEAFQRFCSST